MMEFRVTARAMYEIDLIVEAKDDREAQRKARALDGQETARRQRAVSLKAGSLCPVYVEPPFRPYEREDANA